MHNTMTLLHPTPSLFVSLARLGRAVLAGLACALFAGANPAWADPPARAARIAEVSGAAWLFEPESKSWVRAVRNQTVGMGDQLRTDARSRITLRQGSTTLWLDEQSDLEVLQMDDEALTLRLVTGDIVLRVRTAQAAQETRVQTREGTVTPEIEGLFRIDQLDRGTRLGVLQGRAQFDSHPGAPVQRAWLRETEQAEFWLADSPRIERQPLVRDQFMAWAVAQDQAEGAHSLGDESYVSPEMTGAEDLNQHGRWEVAVEYGNVWIPTRVAAGWEPYRDGRWVWTRHWGWSWVDNAPWGFAPFHYGRWVQHRNHWAWAPGRFDRRPVYSPGLVAWVGGSNVSVGVSVGGHRKPPTQGWSALPPRQAYVPMHPHSPDYSNRFQWNRTHGNNHNNQSNHHQTNQFGPNFGSNHNVPSAPVTPVPRGDTGPQPTRPSHNTWNSAPAPMPAPAPAQPYKPWKSGNAPEVQQNPVMLPAPSYEARPVRQATPFPDQRQSTPMEHAQPRLPAMNRDAQAGGGGFAGSFGSVQPQRPVAVPTPTPVQHHQPAIMQQVPQAPQQQGPQQARPTSEDERSNGKRNKREFADKDFK
jgi:hypothetical protein